MYPITLSLEQNTVSEVEDDLRTLTHDGDQHIWESEQLKTITTKYQLIVEQQAQRIQDLTTKNSENMAFYKNPATKLQVLNSMNTVLDVKKRDMLYAETFRIPNEEELVCEAAYCIMDTWDDYLRRGRARMRVE